MNKSSYIHTVVALILLCSASLASSCAPGKTPPLAERGVMDLRNWDFHRDGWVELSGQWELYRNKIVDPAVFRGTEADGSVNYANCPLSWDEYRSNLCESPKIRYGTYRLTILMNRQQHPMVLKSRDVAPSYTVFINGQEIIKIGTVGEEAATSAPFYVTGVNDFIHDSNKIEIVIQASYYHHLLGYPPEPLILGHSEQIRRIVTRGISFDLFLFTGMMIMALYHLGLFLLRRKDRSTLYFALYCLFIGLFTVETGEKILTQFFPNIGWKTFLNIMHLSVVFSIPVFALFLRSLFPGEFSRKVLRAIIVTALVFSCSEIFLRFGIYWQALIVYQIYILISCGYGIYVLSIAVYRKREGAVPILAGFIVLYISTMNDILHANDIINTGYYIPLGFFIFIILQSFILLMRFTRAMSAHENLSNELEDLNLNLELKVIQRTKQLEDAKNEIEASKDELQSMNENLTVLNHNLSSAKRIMDEDMQMAINVQKKFLPQKFPSTRLWDSAFIFKPMTGISGDLYDHYTIDDDLKGVSLFDVSGHGISSALLSMIAKTLAYRNFMENPDKNLARMLEGINTELILEMKDIDNYLTGIILRITPDAIHYVNAAHEDILFKSGTSGEVTVIEARGHDIKGFFLGVKMLENKYESLEFPVKQGDSILLYSDGLSESVNPDGAHFSLERIIESYKRAPLQATAQEILDIIMEDLYRFVGSQNLSDDCTAIVLKRKSAE